MYRELEPDLYTDLTERQEQVLDFIESCIEKKHRPPTRAEISEHLRLKSPNAAQGHIEALARKGRIIVTPNISRGIQLVTP